MNDFSRLTIGALALQGDFGRHLHQLGLLGIASRKVRKPGDLDGLDGIILPGGESTTMNLLLDRFALRGPLTEFGKSHAVWGTCAGMILLSRRIEDNQAGVTPLGLIDIDVVRNGYGRQVFSFEEPVTADLGDGSRTLRASFIRAPRAVRVGDAVQKLAVLNGDVVLMAQNKILAGAFHTELDDDTTLLEYFAKKVLAGKD